MGYRTPLGLIFSLVGEEAEKGVRGAGASLYKLLPGELEAREGLGRGRETTSFAFLIRRFGNWACL